MNPRTAPVPVAFCRPRLTSIRVTQARGTPSGSVVPSGRITTLSLRQDDRVPDDTLQVVEIVL